MLDFLYLKLKILKQTHTYIVVRHRKLPLIFRAASGRSDRYLLRCRERGWDESVPLGPCSFLINNGRCSTPRLLCIRCIPGSPYEVHLPHTSTHPAPTRKARLSLVPRGHGRSSDSPQRVLGIDNSLSLFTQANIYKKLLNSSRWRALLSQFFLRKSREEGGGGRDQIKQADGGSRKGGAGVVSHVWKVHSGQFNSKPMRQANFPARSSAAASEERLTLTVVITVTLAPNLKSREERSGQDRTLTKGPARQPSPSTEPLWEKKHRALYEQKELCSFHAELLLECTGNESSCSLKRFTQCDQRLIHYAKRL